MANPPGNVLSRPVQFAEYKRLRWNKPGGRLLWRLPPLKDGPKNLEGADGLDIDEDDLDDENGNPKPKDEASDKELVPIKCRWIYAFECSSEDTVKIPQLVREYYADDKGKLTFVDGANRRFVEADDQSAPFGKPTPDAALPHSRQREHCHYVFVATRGRLCCEAIGDIETSLAGKPTSWKMPKIYQPVNLGGSLPSAGPNGPFFAPVIDPLTLAENLNHWYRRALNWFINLSIPHPKNPKEKEIAIDVRKHQLASMIQGSLLHEGDPFDIKPHLTNGGDLMSHYVAKREIAQSNARGLADKLVEGLIDLFGDPIWSQARGWYLGLRKRGPETSAAQKIGHMFHETHMKSIRRLRETREGAKYITKLAHDPEGPRAWVFKPPEEEHKAHELWEKWWPVVRKSITALTLGMAELGPQLMVTGKIAHTKRLVAATLHQLFPVSWKAAQEARLVGKQKGLYARLLKLTPEGRAVNLAYDNLETELKEWVHHNQAEWPKWSYFAKPAHLLTYVLTAVELVNLCDKFHNTLVQSSKQDAAEREPAFVVIGKLVIAGLDVLVAAEEPIREWGTHISSGKVVSKVLARGTFKLLGTVSAFLEAAVAFVEAHEAAEQGEHAAKAGYLVVASGALMAGVGFGLGVFYSKAMAASMLTAAGLSLVVVGIAVVAIGYVIVACVKRTPWQSFAAHCVFGSDRSQGKTAWSGGEFSEWYEESPEALDHQIRALTAMLCGFKIAGEGSASKGSTVRIAFGALPPDAKLQIQFSLELNNKTTMSPGYLIDLEKRTLVHAWGGVSKCRQMDFFGDEKEPVLIVGPLWPEGLWCTKSHCFVSVQYVPQATGEAAHAPEATGAATGTIPVHGVLTYRILDPGSAHTQELESIEARY